MSQGSLSPKIWFLGQKVLFFVCLLLLWVFVVVFCCCSCFVLFCLFVCSLNFVHARAPITSIPQSVDTGRQTSIFSSTRQSVSDRQTLTNSWTLWRSLPKSSTSVLTPSVLEWRLLAPKCPTSSTWTNTWRRHSSRRLLTGLISSEGTFKLNRNNYIVYSNCSSKY